MPKTCQHTGCAYNVWGKGFCKNHQWQRTDKNPKVVKVYKIKPMSKKLSSERVIYRKLRIEFLQKPENMFCAVYPHLLATEIHHPEGRLGKLLNDFSKWIAVSREGHEWIHNNIKLATERGFMRSRLQLTDNLNEK